MLLEEFNYVLPPELIAQTPADRRENSRMMVLERETKSVEHKHFYDITEYFGENDLLVLNNTKVIPARIYAKKADTGAKIEIFLLKKIFDNEYECLIKPSKRVKVSTEFVISGQVKAIAKERLDEDGKWLVKFICEENFDKVLPLVGNIPLPPYIERNMSANEYKSLDFERYQTVYAQKDGSVAAPTAGLHFTKEILDQIKAKGAQIAFVTLNVGLGTFRPVKCENITEHKMDEEIFEIDEENASIIEKARLEGKRITAVGTTSVRTLETTMLKCNKIKPIKDGSRLFIYPGFEFKIVNRLITNFHLPKSTLIMLVSAFAGKDFVFKAYDEAIQKKYRFYSYGDCMLIK